MKNSNDIIGNRIRDLPACSAVPQPTALPRAPNYTDHENTDHSKGNKTVPETVATTHTNRIPKHALRYKPKGRRNIGRPRKRWRDQLHVEDTRNRNQT